MTKKYLTNEALITDTIIAARRIGLVGEAPIREMTLYVDKYGIEGAVAYYQDAGYTTETYEARVSSGMEGVNLGSDVLGCHKSYDEYLGDLSRDLLVEFQTCCPERR